MILAGDIGGTKCNLALYDIHGVSPKKIFTHRYESRQFPTFEQVIAKFLADSRAEAANVRRPDDRSRGIRRGWARH